MKNKIILCTTLLIFSIVSCGQKEKLTEKEFLEIFNKDWCECLEKESEGKSSKEIIDTIFGSCVRNVMLSYTENKDFYESIKQLIKSKNYDPQLSEYERERLFGKEIGKQLMVDAIDNCNIYAESLEKFKQFYVEKILADSTAEDKQETEKLIESMEKGLSEIDIRKANDNQKAQISQYVLMLAMLYDLTGRKELAMTYYEKSLEISENNLALAFQKLLKREKEFYIKVSK